VRVSRRTDRQTALPYTHLNPAFYVKNLVFSPPVVYSAFVPLTVKKIEANIKIDLGKIDCENKRSCPRVKLSLCFFLTEHHAMKVCWGVEVQLHAFLTSAMDGGVVKRC
jgi:hypothetical protein